MNKFILSFLFIPVILASCSTAGAYIESPKGGIIALGPTSFLGEQVVGESEVVTPQGAKITTKGYATHNPDRKLTEAGQVVLTTGIVTKGVTQQSKIASDTALGIDGNSTQVELAAEATKLEGVKGVNAEKILKATPK